MRPCPKHGFDCSANSCEANRRKEITSGEIEVHDENAKQPTKGRDVTRPLYNLLPRNWLKILAEIMKEGLRYGPRDWQNQSAAFYEDCLNHAQDHLSRFFDGDYSEEQLGKVAWNALAANWYYTTGWQKLGHDKPEPTLQRELLLQRKESLKFKGMADQQGISK